MTFTCPLCSQIIVTARAGLNPSPDTQLVSSGQELQMHVMQYHQEATAQLLKLSAQYNLALFLKLFTSTDPNFEEQRQRVYDAAIRTLIDPWQFVTKGPETENRPSTPLQVVR